MILSKTLSTLSLAGALVAGAVALTASNVEAVQNVIGKPQPPRAPGKGINPPQPPRAPGHGIVKPPQPPRKPGHGIVKPLPIRNPKDRR